MVRDTLPLIGGTRDGERVEYRGKHLRMHARSPVGPTPDFCAMSMPTECVAAYDTYRLCTRSRCNRNGCVERAEAYVHDSISDKDAGKRIEETMGWAP